MESEIRKIKRHDQYSESFTQRKLLNNGMKIVCLQCEEKSLVNSDVTVVRLQDYSPELKAISVVICFSHISTTSSTHTKFAFTYFFSKKMHPFAKIFFQVCGHISLKPRL